MYDEEEEPRPLILDTGSLMEIQRKQVSVVR